MGNKKTVVSVIGTNLFKPILDLAPALIRAHRSDAATGGSIGVHQNGYATAMIVMLVVALESFVGRLRYLEGEDPKTNNKSAGKFLCKRDELKSMAAEIDEIFVVRDAITHGHVWETEEPTHPVDGSQAHRLHAGYGDSRHKRTVLSGKTKTPQLHLSVIPTDVGLREVAVVLDVCRRVLDVLARHTPLESGSYAYHDRLEGRPFDFWALRTLLAEAHSGPRLGFTHPAPDEQDVKSLLLSDEARCDLRPLVRLAEAGEAEEPPH